MSSLLDTLLKQVITTDPVKTLSGTTEAKPAQVETLLSEAVPVLVSAMADNASNKKGAESLNKALDSHATDLSSVGGLLSLLTDSDSSTDGAKILKKILGEDEPKVEKKLAKKSGLDTEQVVTILCAVAPIILSLIGNTKQQTNTGSDALGSLLTTLLGGSSSSSSSKKDDGDATAELLGSVLGSLLK